MKLTYRGHSYNYEPAPVDLVESPLVGTYRGQAYSISYPRHIPVPQPVKALKYRGVEYTTTATGDVASVERVAQPQPALGPREVLAVNNQTVFQSRRSLLSEVGRVHRENILRHLQHRMEVARAKGDETLVHQLEREMQFYA